MNKDVEEANKITGDTRTAVPRADGGAWSPRTFARPLQWP